MSFSITPDIIERKISSRQSIPRIEYITARNGSIFVTTKATAVVEKDADDRKYSSELVSELKRKDPIFKKRLKQMELYKKSGRAPFFDLVAEARVERTKFSKSSLDRQRRELVEMSCVSLPRENSHYIYQNKLQEQIALFIKNTKSG